MRLKKVSVFRCQDYEPYDFLNYLILQSFVFFLKPET
jgi:hypothetical protein